MLRRLFNININIRISIHISINGFVGPKNAKLRSTHRTWHDARYVPNE
jgi:hypothetical protein